jgi:hypothetical protein
VANNEVVCRHELIHVRCCAHILNLIVHESLKDVDDLIVRIQNIVKYMKGFPKKLALLKSCAKK